MENLHELTFVAQLRKRLLVELDDQILLSFSGNATATLTTTTHGRIDGEPTLVLAGFRQCVVDYLEYGSDKPHVLSFISGSVSLVGSPRR